MFLCQKEENQFVFLFFNKEINSILEINYNYYFKGEQYKFYLTVKRIRKMPSYQ